MFIFLLLALRCACGNIDLLLDHFCCNFTVYSSIAQCAQLFFVPIDLSPLTNHLSYGYAIVSFGHAMDFNLTEYFRDVSFWFYQKRKYAENRTIKLIKMNKPVKVTAISLSFTQICKKKSIWKSESNSKKTERSTNFISKCAV